MDKPNRRARIGRSAQQANMKLQGTLRFDRANTGDVKIGNVAGRDIVNVDNPNVSVYLSGLGDARNDSVLRDEFKKRRLKGIRLLIHLSNGHSGTICWEKYKIFIGRQDDNDVVIDELEVSRRHACFGWDSEGYYVQDLGSTNGTYLVTSDDVKKIGLHRLKKGDKIKVGLAVIVFEDTEPTAIGLEPPGLEM